MANAEKYLALAVETLKSMELDERLVSYHCAIIVSGGRVLSTGVNKYKMNSFIEHFAHHENLESIHAECDAVLKVRKKIDLSGAKIYVAKLNKHLEVGNSMPCEMCQTVLRNYGIKKVCYTLDSTAYAVTKIKDMEAL